MFCDISEALHKCEPTKNEPRKYWKHLSLLGGGWNSSIEHVFVLVTRYGWDQRLYKQKAHVLKLNSKILLMSWNIPCSFSFYCLQSYLWEYFGGEEYCEFQFFFLHSTILQTELHGIYFSLTRIIFGNSEKVATILTKISSKSVRKYEVR